MKVSRKDLLQVLSAVQAGLATKEILEQSTSFVFADGFVYTYNDEIAISAPIDVDFEGAVQAAEFLKLLNKTPDTEIDLEATDAGLVVKSKKYTATIKLAAKILLPIDKLDIPDKWSKLPSDFAKAVGFCLFSVSTDMTKPALTCIHAFDNRVESTDNYRLTIRKFDKKYFKEPLLIPANAAKELTSFNATQYSAADGWIHFSTDDDVVFSCRTYLELAFPILEKVIELKNPGELKFPADVEEALERTSIFSASALQIEQHITVSLDDKLLTLEGSGDAGKIKETARVRYKGDPCSFKINPGFLSTILKLKSTALVGDSKLRFDDDTFTHVVALMQNV